MYSNEITHNHIRIVTISMLRKLKNKIKTLIKLVRIKLFGVPKTVKYRGFLCGQ